jgi:Rieske Fe-S protein
MEFAKRIYIIKKITEIKRLFNKLFNKITRRDFLLALVCVPLLYFLRRYLSPPTVRDADLEVPLADLPENSVYMVRDKKIAIIHRSGKIRAMSIACTHLGCALNVSDDKFICPCHGSVFALTGEVLKSPAAVNLRELAYETDGTTVKVYA